MVPRGIRSRTHTVYHADAENENLILDTVLLSVTAALRQRAPVEN